MKKINPSKSNLVSKTPAPNARECSRTKYAGIVPHRGAGDLPCKENVYYCCSLAILDSHAVGVTANTLAVHVQVTVGFPPLNVLSQSVLTHSNNFLARSN